MSKEFTQFKVSYLAENPWTEEVIRSQCLIMSDNLNNAVGVLLSSLAKENKCVLSFAIDDCSLMEVDGGVMLGVLEYAKAN